MQEPHANDGPDDGPDDGMVGRADVRGMTRLWLERTVDGPPLARVTVVLRPTWVYGTGHDLRSAFEDLLDELDICEPLADVFPDRVDELDQLRHLTRRERLRWLQQLPDAGS
jgi:hypothetical protein